ncbi:PRC-barrel domain-containing protein [Halomonas sp. PAMB 3232]|uniref:PRC-barrel domain-containing protein n=1 Tax=Halomonas sp. PAMB 3232 TaxID=3075221 RepID=UPI002899F520|nr:PRC-barrel domain-containing protein [Halomonas sp. PAMB 3232]WNL38034.1 PRC-barrel domain-containing protein [Halomonas sp. PAMB 3232]
MKMIKPAFLGTLMVPAFMFAAGANAQSDNAAEPNAQSDNSATMQHSNDMDATYLTSAPQNSFHADALTGNAVLSAVEEDEEIGTINDLIIDMDGQIQAVVVGVGGFLGMGEKDVAIEWDSLDLTMDEDNDDYVIRVNATQEALEEAEGYERDGNTEEMNNDGMNNDTGMENDADMDDEEMDANS